MTPVFTLVAPKSVSRRILMSLWHKIMAYPDLAYLHGVFTKNQAIRWNHKSFPSDFMYQLTTEEKQEELERKISSHGQAIAGLIDVIRQLMQVPDVSGFKLRLSKIGAAADA